MDVHCSTCNEPWDVFHLWQDAVFEIGLSIREAEAWRYLPQKEKLSPHYRTLFRAAGWQFGNSVVNVIRCPECPSHAKVNFEKFEAKALLEELLGDDEDGLAATFEDHEL
jgi:hypothetical protein